MTAHFARQSRIVSLTSGKGGVGKTSIAVNLAAALSGMGRRTLLADCDLGMANAAMLMGLNSPVTINDVLEGRLSVDEVVTEIEDDLFVLPGGSGTGTMPAFGSDARKRLAMGLRPFSRMTDFILVDTPTGASPAAMDSVASADTIILVLSDEPTAFMDAYATAKILTLDRQCTSFHVITNMVANEAAGRGLFGRFHDVVSRFLPASVSLLGSVPSDRHMREAVLHKKPCVLAYPHSPAATAIARIAARLADMPIAISTGGNRFLGQEVSHVVR
jgi:flagellar biosynthesis protein FlhG